MKCILLPLVAASAAAFAPTPFGMSQRASVVLDARVDSSEAVAAALEASKKYGAASKEARVAWDIVEELDASDNSAATGGVVKDENYDDKIAALSALLEEQKAKIQTMKNLALDVKAMKLASPDAAPPAGADTPEMREALANAKKVTDESGADSAEAKLAWATVEEMASGADNSEAMLGSIEEECLVEVIEGCEAIEELSRVLEQS